MSRAGVMEYDDTRIENSQCYCEMCGADVNADGLVIENEIQHSDLERGALKAFEFMVRWAMDDPLCCIVGLLSMGEIVPSCRNISERVGASKTTINAAQMRIEQYAPEIAGIAGRHTAAALSQQARRAFEHREEIDTHPEQMVLL